MHERSTSSVPLLCAYLLLAVSLLGFVAADAVAQERFFRRFAADQGLEVPPIQALAADGAGAIWIGTLGGLYRFDGVEFRRWAPSSMDDAVVRLAAARDGRIAVQMLAGEIFEVTADGAVPIPAPPGGGPWDVRAIAYDAAGRLWSVTGDSVPVVWDRDRWQPSVERRVLAGEGVRQLRAAEDGGILALTSAGLWRLGSAGEEPRRLFDDVVVDLISGPGDRLVVLTTDGRVIELLDGRRRELASQGSGRIPPGRPIALVERKGTIWVALDRSIVAIRAGQAAESIGWQDGLDSGGPLLVDHEGSLWVGAFTGLFQFPEPETMIMHETSGLPGRHTRYLARSGSVLWVTSWQGTARVEKSDAGVTVRAVPELDTAVRPCADSLGVVWLSGPDWVVRLHGDRVVGTLPAQPEFFGCAHSPGPGLWIGTARGLLHADARSGTLRPIDGVPTGPTAPVHAVLEDSGGRLWIVSDEEVCHTPASAHRSGGGGQPATWSCESVPGIGLATSLIELDDGSLWLATRQAGVLARGDDGWRPLHANARLATRDIFALVPSPAGGVWIAGHGILQRVRPGGPEGWELLESPGPGNGLPSRRGADLIEDDDGTLWIATALGLVHMPPEARHQSLVPPRVILVDARVDAEPVPLAAGLELPADRNRLELRFAALSFLEPGRVRYQVRLSPDAPWVETVGQPSFRWVDLPAGRYRAEVRASLDGVSWSAEPARFEFTVLPPWYRTPGALALFSIGVLAALWGVYRARLAYLIGLERQRTRIALDLHDELGSGLGSIGILAGLIPTRGMADAERGRIAGEIAMIAAELGSALADIVWSLDPRTATLEELTTRLAEHGDRLFAGDDVDFRIQMPREWPTAVLPLTIRRNVLRIGVEALHNAARHSGARHVRLAIRGHGGEWELSVSDDGVGIDPDQPSDPRRGRGIQGMRRRADEIGASIAWYRNQGGGTRVILNFTIPGIRHPRLGWRSARGGWGVRRGRPRR